MERKNQRRFFKIVWNWPSFSHLVFNFPMEGKNQRRFLKFYETGQRFSNNRKNYFKITKNTRVVSYLLAITFWLNTFTNLVNDTKTSWFVQRIVIEKIPIVSFPIVFTELPSAAEKRNADMEIEYSYWCWINELNISVRALHFESISPKGARMYSRRVDSLFIDQKRNFK